jgi:hydroxymethylbilane synthase
MANAVRLRIGTRGSPLARAQADYVKTLLAAAHGLDPAALKIEIISTTGDAVRDRPLADLGGKGLFTKEIEEALLAGTIDLAVHSAKDVPTFLPDGLTLAAYPQREDPRDAFMSRNAETLSAIPAGALLGTASVRREALLRRLRPDIEVKLLRGNVQTRLDKVASGEFHGTVLALAGLKRLGLAAQATEVLDPEIFPPAVAQGAIGIELRTGDEATRAMVAAIDHAETATALAAERAFLGELDGSCRTPIAGHAQLVDSRLYFYGMLISLDGRESVETRREGAPEDAARIGREAGIELKQRAPASLLAVLK